MWKVFLFEIELYLYLIGGIYVHPFPAEVFMPESAYVAVTDVQLLNTSGQKEVVGVEKAQVVMRQIQLLYIVQPYGGYFL